MLSEKDIVKIAEDYAEQNKSQYCFFQLIFVRKSQFLDGYYDVKYKVMGYSGREIDASLMVAIDIQSGNIISMEELVKRQMQLEGQENHRHQ